MKIQFFKKTKQHTVRNGYPKLCSHGGGEFGF